MKIESEKNRSSVGLIPDIRCFSEVVSNNQPEILSTENLSSRLCSTIQG